LYPDSFSEFSKFIHLSKYSRWNEDLGRRETWGETVDRWWDWLTEQAARNGVDEVPSFVKEMVYNREVMPSMRSMMTAGKAADRDNTCIFNCSYLELDSPTALAELLYILMNGTGVGYSVERRVTDKWRAVPSTIIRDENQIITVVDSKAGWADVVKTLLNSLLAGVHPTWDLSKIRPAGARLKTFGGRASGPEPLEDCLRFLTKTIYGARGRKMRPIEIHDMACIIANAVIVGGVRRSAMISLSDLDDYEMARAKSGNWWEQYSYRSLANNSAVYTTKPEIDQWMEEWLTIYRSYSGERGIFNREAAQGGPRGNHNFGTNPCGEITLRPMQFCNLSEVVLRRDQSNQNKKVEAATIIGCIQATCTHFPYLRKKWRDNTEEEALLGVSLTGICDYVPSNEELRNLRTTAHEIAKIWSQKLGINMPTAITTVKPSGTVSCLVDSSSGIHERWSQHYIRRVRMDVKDPMCQLMKDFGIPGAPCVNNPTNTYVFEFPIGTKAPVVHKTALDQLRLWATVKQEYTDHNPSVTITYYGDEYMQLGDQLYRKYWDIAQGLSFLPKTDHVYAQAPYEAITREKYHELRDAMPIVDWSLLSKYELEDNTKSGQAFACTGGACEIVDTTDN
jgi:ribonucleoside-triphosphate reductase (thioredoxin)